MNVGCFLGRGIHLTADNHATLLERARNKTKREVALLVAVVAPQPDVPSQTRKLPAPRGSTQRPHDGHDTERLPTQPRVDETGLAAAPAGGTVLECPRRAEDAGPVHGVVARDEPVQLKQRVPMTFALEAPRASSTPLRPGHFKWPLTASQSLEDKLTQLRHLLRHQVPGGDMGAIIELAFDVLLEKKLKQRFAQVAKPRTFASCRKQEGPDALSSARCAKKSRYIPRAVVRAVFARDGGQCTFTSPDGQRCSEQGMLEMHHIYAYAFGGAATVENLTFNCRQPLTRAPHQLGRTELVWRAVNEPVVGTRRS